jgi:hypothetical protein
MPAQQVSQHTGTQPLVLLQPLPWHQTQANQNSSLQAGPFLPAEQLTPKKQQLLQLQLLLLLLR